jgi:hypothetical protein
VRPANDYLIWSVFNTCCCCCLLGLIATIFSFKTRFSNHYPNQISTSQGYSRIAFKLNVCSTTLGICFLLIGTIYEIAELLD